MTTLMNAIGARALRLGVPLSVQLDLTYRCNERCVHCYLDHTDRGEVTLPEVMALLPQLAQAGTLFLALSGGELFLRRDLLEIVAEARRLMFAVRLKTNGTLISERDARRLAELAVESVQISIYSHRAATHDAITMVPGSFDRSIRGISVLREAGIKTGLAHIVMRQNSGDYPHVQALAEELGAEFTLDATITPMMDGGRTPLALNVSREALRTVLRDPALVPPAATADVLVAKASSRELLATCHDDEMLAALPCSAGHTSCYVSPYGDVFPCVQFPLACGNVRSRSFADIWQHSRELADVRSIRLSDLDGCSSCGQLSECSRCPGLAYMEGNVRGPSAQDCEKVFARTGILPGHLAGATPAVIPLTPV